MLYNSHDSRGGGPAGSSCLFSDMQQIRTKSSMNHSKRTRETRRLKQAPTSGLFQSAVSKQFFSEKKGGPEKINPRMSDEMVSRGFDAIHKPFFFPLQVLGSTPSQAVRGRLISSLIRPHICPPLNSPPAPPLSLSLSCSNRALLFICISRGIHLLASGKAV